MNTQENISLIKRTIKDLYNVDSLTPEPNEQQVPPHSDTHPLDYINNYSWLDDALKNKVEEIKNLYHKTEEDPKLFDYYLNSSDFSKQHFYNKERIQKLDQFIALINNCLIDVAKNSGRYTSTGGSWFIGAGLSIYTRDKPQRKKKFIQQVFNLGYGNGDGAARKLQDISDILKYYNLDVIVDHGRIS